MENDNLTTVTDPRGSVTNDGHPTQNRLTSVKNARGTTAVTFTYDTGNRVAAETLANAGKRTYAYTVAAGHITQTLVTDPRVRGKKTTNGYDRCGRLTRVTDPNGTPPP